MPVAVWGTSSVTTTSSGVFNEPSRSRTHSRTWSVSISSLMAVNLNPDSMEALGRSGLVKPFGERDSLPL